VVPKPGFWPVMSAPCWTTFADQFWLERLKFAPFTSARAPGSTADDGIDLRPRLLRPFIRTLLGGCVAARLSGLQSVIRILHVARQLAEVSKILVGGDKDAAENLPYRDL
jgi:hypothetical protein